MIAELISMGSRAAHARPGAPRSPRALPPARAGDAGASPSVHLNPDAMSDHIVDRAVPPVMPSRSNTTASSDLGALPRTPATASEMHPAQLRKAVGGEGVGVVISLRRHPEGMPANLGAGKGQAATRSATPSPCRHREPLAWSETAAVRRSPLATVLNGR